MFANPSWNCGRHAFWVVAFFAVTFLSGCATTTTTTTTTLETTMHSDDITRRFQSYDVTARVQMELQR